VHEAAGTSTNSTHGRVTLPSWHMRCACTVPHELADLGGHTAFYKAEGGLRASHVLLPGAVSLTEHSLTDSSLTSTSTAPLTQRMCKSPTPAQQYVCTDTLRPFPARRTDEPVHVHANTIGPCDGSMCSLPSYMSFTPMMRPADSLGGDLFRAASASVINHHIRCLFDDCEAPSRWK
jgi:hypothetical protein